MTTNRAASIRARLKQHADKSKQDFNLTLTRYGLEEGRRVLVDLHAMADQLGVQRLGGPAGQPASRQSSLPCSSRRARTPRSAAPRAACRMRWLAGRSSVA